MRLDFIPAWFSRARALLARASVFDSLHEVVVVTVVPRAPLHLERRNLERSGDSSYEGHMVDA